MAGGAPFQLTIDGVDYFAAFAGGSATTPYVIPESVTVSSDADGGGQTFSFEVEQRVTPGSGPWFTTIPDNATVKFIDTSLSSNTTLFAGFVGGVSARLNGGGQGTIATVECLTASSIMERVMLVRGTGTLAGVRGATVSVIRLRANRTDKVIIEELLDKYIKSRVTTINMDDLFDATITTGISSTATIGPTDDDGRVVEIPLGTWRAAMDTIMELAEARDGKQRRYYIDSQKRLVYGFASAADSSITYANAPFKIITTGTDNPAGGTATASTLFVRDLEVEFDHDSSRKRAFFLTADSASDVDTAPDPYVRTYTEVGFAARTGSMITDALVEVPTIRRARRATQITNAAKAYFARRHKPIKTIKFTVRGAGTATGQVYGYSGGTVQTGFTEGPNGTATYGYVDRWAPGQWVSITASAIGLDTALYRIENVEMSFEQASLVRVWKITAEHRPIREASLLINVR